MNAFFLGQPEGFFKQDFTSSKSAIHNDIASRVQSACSFGRVVFASNDDLDGAISSDGNIACIIPDINVQESVEPVPNQRFCQVTYGVVLKIRSKDRVEAISALESIGALVKSELSGKSFAGITMSEQSLVSNGRFDNSEAPNYLLSLTGRFGFVYEI